MISNALLTSGILVLLIAPQCLAAQDDNSTRLEYKKNKTSPKTSTASQFFDIYIRNNHIGTYEAKMTKQGSITQYSAKSETVVRILVEIKVKYDLSCTFKDGFLVKSSVRSYRNDNLKSETQVTWTGSEYQIITDGELTTASIPIRRSTIQLYFDGPPKNDGMIFSEREAKMKHIRKVKDEHFLIADPGKNKGTEFIYKNAALEEVKVSFALGSFNLVQPDK